MKVTTDRAETARARVERLEDAWRTFSQRSSPITQREYIAALEALSEGDAGTEDAES